MSSRIGICVVRQVKKTYTNKQKYVLVREEPCCVPLQHNINRKSKGICLCVSKRGGTHSKGVPLPGGRSAGFYPLEPLNMAVGLILVHTHKCAQSHKCHTNPMQQHAGTRTGREMGQQNTNKLKEKNRSILTIPS